MILKNVIIRTPVVYYTYFAKFTRRNKINIFKPFFTGFTDL